MRAYLRSRPLRTRLTVAVVAVIVLCFWLLAFTSLSMLRSDLKRQLGEQQLSTASIVADQIDLHLQARFRALELLAHDAQLSPSADRRTMETYLGQRPILLSLFNGGGFVTDVNGVAVASVPDSIPRVGVSYSERDSVLNALTKGKTSISTPVLGKVLKTPVVSLATPLRDANNRIVGALVGVTDLSRPNFLDTVIEHSYGKTGGYLLVDPVRQVAVTSSESRHIVKSMTDSDVAFLSQQIGKSGDGEGYGVSTNDRGVESLVANHPLETNRWQLVVVLPTTEAFASIGALQHRLILLASALTLLAAALSWWVLRRELAPLLTTAQVLANLEATTQFPAALPIQHADEIGQLVTGFNRLLVTLQAREAALLESKQRFRTLVEWTTQAIVVHAGGKLLFANPAAVRLLEAGTEAELVGRPFLNFIHPDWYAMVTERAARAIISGTVTPALEYQIITARGRTTSVEVSSIAIDYDGHAASLVAIYDVTHRKAVEDQLQQLSRITEQAPMSIAITNLQGDIEYVNPRFTAVTGYSPEEVIGQNPSILQSGETPPAIYADMWQTLTSGQVWRGEFINRKKNGERFIEQSTVAPVLDANGRTTHYAALKEDITVRKLEQARLEQLLREQTALLNEVHHRVKNNMQVITSLLRLEEGRTPLPATQAVLADMRGRIRSMALVHETLYRSGKFSAVELNIYVEQVATAAFRSQVGPGVTVRLKLDLKPVWTSLDQATPCGLLVNELVSNALKHGFPAGGSGEIRIDLHPATAAVGESTDSLPWVLGVSDTGMGLPQDFASRREETLGLQLVSDLARQLGGSLQIESSYGAHFTVTFPLDAQAPPHTAP